jgi:uncharacterized delta-60 repeat protein
MQKNKNFPWVATPLAIAISSFAAGNALASATTDTSFGVNGIASLNFNYIGLLYPDYVPIYDPIQEPYSRQYGAYGEPAPIVARQPIVELNNGDLVSFASRYEETGTRTKNYGYSYYSGCVGSCWGYISFGNLAAGTSKTRMSRFTANGAPITAVDIGGVMATSALEQPDGKLLMMGNDLVRGSGTWRGLPGGSIQPKPTLTSQIVLMRFNADGSADTTFDGDGTLSLGVPGTRQAEGLALMPDGKIVVLSADFNFSASNPQLWRFNSDGSVDTSFGGGDGNLALPIPNAWGLLEQQDNKLLLRYNDSNLQAYARFNTDGSLDTSFAGDGTLNIAQPFYAYAPMLQQANGTLLLAANHVYRYDLSGTYQQTLLIPAGASQTLFSLAETSVGDILVANRNQYPNSKIYVYYNTGVINATLDLDLYFSYGSSDGDSIGDILLQTNGFLLASGRQSDDGSAVLNRQSNIAVDTDGDGGRDIFDADDDNDGVLDVSDNCPLISNASQLDSDSDAQGDICDVQPFIASAGTLDLGFNPGTGANNNVYTSAVQADGKIIIGGDFATVNAVARSKIARLNIDGSVDMGFNPGTGANNIVYTSAVQADGKVIIGGDFATVNGVARNKIARLNVDGSVDMGFNPGSGASSTVRTCALQADGKIIIGGIFPTVNGVARNRIARLNVDGSLDLSFNPSASASDVVYDIAVQPDGKIIIGGEFTGVNGVVRKRIARLYADGSLDLSFNPGTGVDGYYHHVYTIAVQADGKIIIGGNFNTVNDVAIDRIARLNADGSVDLSFNHGTGANNTVRAIAVQPDGKIIIGGGFTTVNGVARNYIMRLNADGIADSSFNPGTGANDWVSTIAVLHDGRIVIGGDFTTFNGVTRNRIARVHSGDSDYDGIEDAADQFPNDTDNDGLTNDIDTDDDNDGMPDTWETTYGLNPLLNDANGDLDGDGFSNKTEFDNGTDPTVVDAVSKTKNDYNNDGIAGWIWKGISNGNETSSQNWQLTFPLYSNNWGGPNRFYHPVFPDQANWDIVTTGDFNKDGDADILWRNNATAQWKVWQMQNGIRSAQNDLADFDLAHEWTVVGAGDTDKDGDDDVILNNTSTGEYIIWEMQNHAMVAQSGSTTSGYVLIRIGDFNKDGDVDLLFRENGGDLLMIRELENPLVIEHTFVNTGAGYNPVCAGDFDKDGDDDIMLVNSATTQEKWFVMENFTRTQKVGSTNTGFVFKGCGDYDGDGDADILWQRSSDDANRVILQQNYGSTKQTVYTNAFGGANGFVYRGNSN